MQIEVFYASLYYFLIYRRKQNFTHPISKIYTTMPYLIDRVLGECVTKGVCTKLWTKFKIVRIGQILLILAIPMQTGMQMDAKHLQECAVSKT